jgi:ATPase family associated with various cellular activities (AAA)
MNPSFPAIDARLQQLKEAAGLDEAETRIARALAEAFRIGLDRLAEVPPSRRRWSDFWAGQRDSFTDGVSRTGEELLGLAAGPEEERRLTPSGRLFTAEAVRLLKAGENAAASRYILTPPAARALFAYIAVVDADLLETGLLLITPGAARPNEVSEGARRMDLRSSLPAQPFGRKDPREGDRPKRGSGLPRASEPADDPETTPEEALFDLREPEIGFEQVFLAADTLREIRIALVQIRKHPLLVEQWGLGERYRMGRGLAFNFAGPAGTGKTLTAEAVAKDLGRPLLTVKYSGLESKWIGETGKHIAAVFAAAARHQAVLFFDEADAIASRRTANLEGSGRHYNLSVNILLSELEQHDGVVIFATNLAANFDPAFERRVQSHVLFSIPAAEERQEIWRAHLPPRAPLAPDVDLRRLAEDFELAGGDIRNAMLKAVRLAALDDAPDHALCITQEHLLAGARAVLHGRMVMTQSILAERGNGGT